ncbi:carboxypeptidase-like regulatory domain-containing protein [Fibrella sp. WM1]|uniref:carboxypeptidase-like regulatory domain-containing protein n=1 Tax=Fibrella musci TaxID=3242485 RepID=UPI0035210132
MNKLLLSVLLLLLTGSVMAQQRTIRGRVIDAADRTPLPGVIIALKGEAFGTTTDSKGQFRLTIPLASKTLLASYIGYVTQPIDVPATTDSVLIRLVADGKSLDEVVVMGYGTAAKREAMGSVATVPGSRSRTASAPRRAHYSTASVTPSSSVYSATSADREAGQLTAGEIHDYSKWTLWGDIAQKELRDYRTLWRVAPAERYSVQVVSANGFPLIDVPVRLFDNQRQLIWETRTDNTGRSELWANLFQSADSTATNRVKGKVSAEVVVAGKTYTLNRLQLFGKGDNTLTVDQPCGGAAQTVDVAFVVDATGSMGDEISYLKAELTDVINRAKQAAPNSTIRLGSVFYRDRAEEYLTRHDDFTTQPDSAVAFIKEQEAGGGGDYPEAVDTALAVALTKLSWSPAAKTRLLFLVLDAPPHDDAASIASLQRSVAKAAAMGIRLIPLAASGIDKSTEYLLRSMALGTNGTYVFLTDDSGIGNPHIKPTTDQYTVEKLNALLVRLITKFTQTPDCQPPTVANVPTASPQVRYTEQGQPVDSTAAPAPTFRYFPNPTRDYLTIENAAAIDELFVMDITGKVLMRETPNRPVARLDMQAYPTGTYLFRFNATQRWQAGRFILHR